MLRISGGRSGKDFGDVDRSPCLDGSRAGQRSAKSKLLLT